MTDISLRNILANQIAVFGNEPEPCNTCYEQADIVLALVNQHGHEYPEELPLERVGWRCALSHSQKWLYEGTDASGVMYPDDEPVYRFRPQL